MKYAIALVLLGVLAVLAAGCTTTHDDSSLPWAEPEPWENQPNFGVPY
ncbi:MAG TPA: hypothetical protein PK636_06565 [bacterium]|nr:hypothetical protein [bacterium]HPJ72327.1 hypothetical protein [bacterium]HPQ66478.1 hypothetical protein [bacterium]